MKQTIFLSMIETDPVTGESVRSKFPVEADIKGGLGVHKGNWRSDCGLTHVATGLSIANALFYREAVALRKALLTVYAGWEREDAVEDMKRDEAVYAAVVKIVKEARAI